MPSLLGSPPSVSPPFPVEAKTHHPESPGEQQQQQRPFPDPNRLAPEDAYYAPSLKARAATATANYDGSLRTLKGNQSTTAVAALRLPNADTGGLKVRGTSRRRRQRKGAWKKLLWVKQSCMDTCLFFFFFFPGIGVDATEGWTDMCLIDPDNYTDTETFLDHLQRNPRVRPYDFWPLVADSTVIVQHVCSVAIFICCFVGIVQGRVSPVSVVCWGSVGTAMGWVLWDASPKEHGSDRGPERAAEEAGSSSSSVDGVGAKDNNNNNNQVQGLGLAMASNYYPQRYNAGLGDAFCTSDPAISTIQQGGSNGHHQHPQHDPGRPPLHLSSRNRQRLSTVKSAFLIYFALLGLSPILKSLTKSTASDSIWAMSCWLLFMNIFSFDYGSGEGAGATEFPASLSTHAAVMASTVLASRLPSTTHVFSLMLFSIEVFGLFPIFRRQLRHNSWTGHVLLTLALVITAGGAVGITMRGGWASAVVGSILGSLLTALTMGGCSWWLISLQKYKNVVIGPWDPARPVIRRHWD